jgi:hypothetical protein
VPASGLFSAAIAATASKWREKAPPPAVECARFPQVGEDGGDDLRVAPLRPERVPWPAMGPNGRKFMTSWRDW